LRGKADVNFVASPGLLARGLAAPGAATFALKPLVAGKRLQRRSSP
jgi:hypothetical protein